MCEKCGYSGCDHDWQKWDLGAWLEGWELFGNGYERDELPDGASNGLYVGFISAEIDTNTHRKDKKMIEEIVLEVKKATEKFPTWPTDPLHALAVLGEEFGELTKEMVQMTYEPHKTSKEAVKTEAIQTAAMALRLVMSLDKYKYTPLHQHEQRLTAQESEA